MVILGRSRVAGVTLFRRNSRLLMYLACVSSRVCLLAQLISYFSFEPQSDYEPYYEWCIRGSEEYVRKIESTIAASKPQRSIKLYQGALNFKNSWLRRISLLP